VGAARPQGLSLHGAARAKRLLVRPVRRRPWIRRVSAVVSLGEGSRGRLDGSPITVFGLSGRSSGEISFVVLFFCPIAPSTPGRCMCHVPFFSPLALADAGPLRSGQAVSLFLLSLPSSWNTGLDLDFDSNLLCVCVCVENLVLGGTYLISGDRWRLPVFPYLFFPFLFDFPKRYP